jgi:hypothetical protein
MELLHVDNLSIVMYAANLPAVTSRLRKANKLAFHIDLTICIYLAKNLFAYADPVTLCHIVSPIQCAGGEGG